MPAESKQVPTLFIFGESKSGKDTIASGIAREVPGLAISSTSQLLTELKQDFDRRMGLENPPSFYPRDVLYQFGVSLQQVSADILAVMMMKTHQRKYVRGEIAGLLYVGSRRLAEAEYIHNVVCAPLIGVTAPQDVRLGREYQWWVTNGFEVNYDELRANFEKQDLREKPELEEMFTLADIVIDGNQPQSQVIDQGLSFVRSRNVFS